ncbi:MAG TPA: VCBS repeat-containing protein [Methylomirabilota bacterium]|jgi:hypothetical protein|nr:VCBS repeat-containing protein [Methylomirabilota bacterium]
MKRRSLQALVAPAILTVAILGVVSLPWAQTPGRQIPTASSAPLQAIVNQVVALFPRVSGDVVEVQGTTVTLSVGKRDGVVPGLELTLFREGRELKHPKTGEVLGKTEKALGKLRVEEVAEAYAVGKVAPGTDVAPGDVARISAGKARVTVVPFVVGVRESVVEAGVSEIVEGLTRSGRVQVAMGDQIGVWAGQQGIKPEEFLEGKGLADGAGRFRAEHLLALHFKTVERKPYVEARFFTLPSTAALVSSATFVPASVRAAAPRERFSSGGDRQPPQPKQRSLLARILGGELEAGSYSSGENSIPLKEIGRFAFPVLAMDVSVAPKDQIARLVMTDGEKIWMYRVVERALEPEWTWDERFTTPGKLVSVQLADLDGDGALEVVVNRYHPDPQILQSSFILGTKDGRPVTLVKETSEILWAVDADGSGVKKTLWAQGFSHETFFRKGQARRVALKGGKLVTEGPVRVPATFRATGASMANIAGKGTRALVYVDEYQRLRITVDTEETWRSSSPVGGGAYLKMELLKSGTTSRNTRSEFFYFEPVPVAVDLDGDGIEEVIVPQNQLEGHLGIVFRGPAGYRFQSVNSGFEGTITALGAIPGDTPPTLIAAVVRFNTFLKGSGETQIIMTTGE